MSTMTLTKPETKKEPSKSPKNTATGSSKGFSLAEYFKGVKGEWQRISWPTQFQVWQQTLVVLIMVTLVTLMLWGTDNLLHFVVSLIVPTAGKH